MPTATELLARIGGIEQRSAKLNRIGARARQASKSSAVVIEMAQQLVTASARASASVALKACAMTAERVAGSIAVPPGPEEMVRAAGVRHVA